MEPYFQAIHHTALGEWLRSEVWRVPAVEFVHLIGIVLLFGSLLIVNLRLMGVLLGGEPVRGLAEDVGPFQKLGLVLLLISGPVMFVGSAVKMYNTESFWWKMGFLAAALVYQFTIHWRLTRRSELARGTAALTGVVSMGLWFAVLLNGMWTLLS